MTTLKELCPVGTDKDTVHSYLHVYEKLFSERRNSATRVGEIGIFTGASLKLWQSYFPNAQILGIDTRPFDLKTERIQCLCGNAYSFEIIQDLKAKYTSSFDVFIDDGPHTLQSQCDFLKHYGSLIKPDGLLIVEDIQHETWLPELLKQLDSKEWFTQVFDLRHIKGRYDDILLVATKLPMQSSCNYLAQT